MGLSAYSMIRMRDGSERRVEDLAAGDSVFDPLANRAVVLSSVCGNPGVGMTALEADNGRVLHLTGDQRVYGDNGGIMAGQVRAGNRLRVADGFAACTEAGMLPGDFQVYDLRGDGLSAVLANGFMVGV